MQKPILSDLPAGMKVLILFSFFFISAVLFYVLGVQLSEILYDVDLTNVDYTKVDDSRLSDYRNAQLLVTMCYQLGGFLLPALTFFQFAHKEGVLFSRFNITPRLKIAAWTIILGVATLWGLLYVRWINELIVGSIPSLNEFVEEINSSAETRQRILLSGGWAAGIINVVLIGMIVPVCEEFFFRAGIQQYMIQASKKALPAILVTSFVFALLHMEFNGFLVRFTMSVALGYVFIWTGSIWTSVLLHSAYNITGVIVEYIQVSYELQAWVKIMPAIGLTVAGIMIYLLYRRRIIHPPLSSK